MDETCGPSSGLKTLTGHFDSDRSIYHHSTSQKLSMAQQFRNAPGADQRKWASSEYTAFMMQERHDQEPFLRPEALEYREISFIGPETRNARQTNCDVLNTSRNWGSDFLTLMQTDAIQPIGSSTQSQRQMSGLLSYRPMSRMQMHLSAPTASRVVVSDEIDQEAFARAFATAEASIADMSLVAGPLSTVSSAEVDREADIATKDCPEPERTRNDLEADALSHTAGELIDALKNEQSEKFRDSSFMALMHKLRDRKIGVQNNTLVNIGESDPIQT